MTCIQCSKDLLFQQKRFCSKSCAAKYNNCGRIRTEESKLKTSAKLKAYVQQYPEKYYITKDHPKMKGLLNCIQQRKRATTESRNCISCLRPFIATRRSKQEYRKTCSNQCRDTIRIKNASTTHRTSYNNHTFDSKWEVDVAQFLDKNKIEWIQPVVPVKWSDSIGKQRNYYPDFYLPKLNLYLDPKNPIVISIQREKLQIVSKLIPLIYGTPEHIKLSVMEARRGLEPL